MKHFLLGFFPYGAGVKQQNVGFLWFVGGYHAVTGTQQICHARRVVLVHLATVGLYKYLFGLLISHVSARAVVVGAGEYTDLELNQRDTGWQKVQLVVPLRPFFSHFGV